MLSQGLWNLTCVDLSRFGNAIPASSTAPRPLPVVRRDGCSAEGWLAPVAARANDCVVAVLTVFAAQLSLGLNAWCSLVKTGAKAVIVQALDDVAFAALSRAGVPVFSDPHAKSVAPSGALDMQCAKVGTLQRLVQAGFQVCCCACETRKDSGRKVAQHTRHSYCLRQVHRTEDCPSQCTRKWRSCYAYIPAKRLMSPENSPVTGPWTPIDGLWGEGPSRQRISGTACYWAICQCTEGCPGWHVPHPSRVGWVVGQGGQGYGGPPPRARCCHRSEAKGRRGRGQGQRKHVHVAGRCAVSPGRP